MNNDIITIYDGNHSKDYKLLCIIDKEYKYLIYTERYNMDVSNNLYAIKVNSLDNKEILTISDNEWKMIEEEYNKLIKGSE